MSSKQLFKVVGQTHCVELDDAALKVLDPAWMHVSQYPFLGVEELKRLQDLSSDVKHFNSLECLLAERFPVLDWLWDVCLYEDEVVGHDPVLFYWDDVLMVELRQ